AHHPGLHAHLVHHPHAGLHPHHAGLHSLVHHPRLHAHHARLHALVHHAHHAGLHHPHVGLQLGGLLQLIERLLLVLDRLRQVALLQRLGGVIGGLRRVRQVLLLGLLGDLFLEFGDVGLPLVHPHHVAHHGLLRVDRHVRHVGLHGGVLGLL